MYSTSNFAINIINVISEPGDGTRYNYIVYEEYDNFYFFSLTNNFIYPQKIYKLNDNVEEIAKKYNCNPCTVQECLRTIRKLTGREEITCK